MTVKLVSANMGIVLVVEKNGKQERKEFNCIIPTHIYDQPIQGIGELLDFLNDELGTKYVCYSDSEEKIKIARPAKIKARKTLTQNQFNEKIKELVP